MGLGGLGHEPAAVEVEEDGVGDGAHLLALATEDSSGRKKIIV